MHAETGAVAARDASRIPELDGLRGLAILLVFLDHYIGNADSAGLPKFLHRLAQAFAGGWSGVDLFFVLSGFLIGGILLDAKSSPRYFETFYLRRVHRILPIYYAWLLAYEGIVLLARTGFAGIPGPNWASLSPLPFYFLFLQNFIYQQAHFQWQWLAVTWSLAGEEQFYLVAPPLVRFLSVPRLKQVLAATIVIAPFLRYAVYRFHLDGYVAAVFAMPGRADALAVGILAAILWRTDSFQEFLARRTSQVKRAAWVLGAGVVALYWWFVHPVSAVTVTIGYTWLALFYVTLLVLALSQPAGLVARCARMPWLRGLGTISYCVYLIHFSFNELAHEILLHARPSISSLQGLGVTLLAAALTLVVAKLSWRYYEKPLVRRGRRYSY